MKHSVVRILLVAILAASGVAAQSGEPAPNERDRALIAAAAKGDARAVQRLLEDGASVGAADEQGVTALIAAAYGNHIAVTRLLIEAGADVNLADSNGVSPLAHARRRGFPAMTNLLEQAGAR